MASGGTDLFCAGVQRVLEPRACGGVHSWAAEDFTATDLPRSDPGYDRYLDYYSDINMVGPFYWFISATASAGNMHWVTTEEANQYNVSTHKLALLGTQADCNTR